MTRRLTIPVGPRDHIQGSPHAPIVLVEYGDYECPYCGQAYPVVKQLQERLGDELAFVFRNYPLTQIHHNALRAAETAEWAALSKQFWPMHDYLFEHQRRLGTKDLLDAAAELGLDHHQLAVAWNDHSLRPRIVEDVESGTASGVGGTPTFFINGHLYEGATEVDDLIAAADFARRRK